MTQIVHEQADSSPRLKLGAFSAKGLVTDRLLFENGRGRPPGEVRMLVYNLQQPGQYTVVWDGRDEKGREVASGIYLYRLEAVDRGFVETQRMMLLR